MIVSRKGRYPRKEATTFEKIVQFILDKRNSRRHSKSFAKTKRGFFRRQERKFVRSYCEVNGETVLGDDTWNPVELAIAQRAKRDESSYFAALEERYGYGRRAATR